MAEYNEDAYRLARETYIEHSCPFERALLSRCVACSRSRRLNLAEREAIACGDAAVREHCLAFHQALHDNAQFALKIAPMPSSQPSPSRGEGANATPQPALRFPLPNPRQSHWVQPCPPLPQAGEGANVTPKPINAPWPFGKEIRAQCGGVRGLAEAMDAAGDESTDIAATVLQARAQYGDHTGFPYSEIMRAVVHYEPRKRRS